ncbi:hypothetical protein Ahy_B09g096350 isoform Q [Arachis hypogaea]|uniref:Uncharacterized protein n=1 Tax=Arachis hypogaea TaxID=3818 RepID=A0A444XK46_ARAHY|nr:hypothetical protein Ahy_B09g096350 isoform Q [Arachis hypogaea]
MLFLRSVVFCNFSLFYFRRFDIKWTAPKAVGSFSDARGDIIISHDFITVNSASAAFDLYMKVLTSYSDDFALKRDEFNASRDIPFTVDGIELDLRMRGFEFFSLVSTYTLDFPRPLVLKSTGRIKFHGKVLKPNSNVIGQNFENNRHDVPMLEKGSADSLVGDISISDLKLNQLMLAPQLSGQLRVSSDCIKVMNKTSFLKFVSLSYYSWTWISFPLVKLALVKIQPNIIFGGKVEKFYVKLSTLVK